MTQKKGWSKKAKSVGYGVEYACVQYYRKQGILAWRIPQKQQKGAFRSIDVIVCQVGRVIQCKRRKKYLRKPEAERIKTTAKNFRNIKPLLCWRDRGLRFEEIK